MDVQLNELRTLSHMNCACVASHFEFETVKLDISGCRSGSLCCRSTCSTFPARGWGRRAAAVRAQQQKGCVD
eukprot:1150797-Pelagomonas_calceolata.AAC.2